MYDILTHLSFSVSEHIYCYFSGHDCHRDKNSYPSSCLYCDNAQLPKGLPCSYKHNFCIQYAQNHSLSLHSVLIWFEVAHVSYLGFISETEDPTTFPKSLAMLQIVDTVMYLVTALVIYRLAGNDITSPALSSAGHVMKKVCYGLAIPTVS